MTQVVIVRGVQGNTDAGGVANDVSATTSQTQFYNSSTTNSSVITPVLAGGVGVGVRVGVFGVLNVQLVNTAAQDARSIISIIEIRIAPK